MNAEHTIEETIKLAARHEKVDDLIKLCKTNPKDIIEFRYRGKQIIHVAAEIGSTDLLQNLLQIGADLKVFTDEQYYHSVSILHIACEKGNNALVKFIFKNIPEVSFWKALSYQRKQSSKSYRNAFYYAAKSGVEEVVKCLQSDGNLNINDYLPSGRTVLQTLIYEQDSKAVEILCKCGATFNFLRFERGLTAIQYLAEKRGASQTIKVLLNHGANVNDIWSKSSRWTSLRQSPLFMALKNSISSNAKVLLEHGANVHFVGQTSSSGPIACFPFAIKRCPDLVADFLQQGANSNEIYNGQPMLLYAMEHCHGKVIEALIEAGADVNTKWRGKSVIEHCSSFGKYCPSKTGTALLRNSKQILIKKT